MKSSPTTAGKARLEAGRTTQGCKMNRCQELQFPSMDQCAMEPSTDREECRLVVLKKSWQEWLVLGNQV
ncbi:hypothetical protein NQZ68_035387 [Dissostichus eleginoides]|nr:hypothetical protein NQZ68_035387 [Dissostichus eleginoides]